MLSEEDVANRAALLVKLGQAYQRLGDYPVATQHFEEGLTLAQEAGDPQTEVAALNWLGEAAWWQGAYDTEAHHPESGLALARERDDRGAQHLLCGTWAMLPGDGGSTRRESDARRNRWRYAERSAAGKGLQSIFSTWGMSTSAWAMPMPLWDASVRHWASVSPSELFPTHWACWPGWPGCGRRLGSTNKQRNYQDWR